MAAEIQEIVDAVGRSRKWRHVCPQVVSTIARERVRRGEGVREAIKATKRVLHQVAGAYGAPGAPHRWCQVLRETPPSHVHLVCERLLKTHVSTRERWPYLRDFYAQVLAGIGPVATILDVGCGLNPLAFPWMGLPRSVRYVAVDILEPVARLVEAFFSTMGIVGECRLCDVVCDPPAEASDVALVLKLLPCLEHIEAGAGERLLDALRARWLLVSFPRHSLDSGKGKGMSDTYTARFLGLAHARGWEAERLVFPDELVFRVRLA